MTDYRKYLTEQLQSARIFFVAAWLRDYPLEEILFDGCGVPSDLELIESYIWENIKLPKGMGSADDIFMEIDSGACEAEFERLCSDHAKQARAELKEKVKSEWKQFERDIRQKYM